MKRHYFQALAAAFGLTAAVFITSNNAQAKVELSSEYHPTLEYPTSVGGLFGAGVGSSNAGTNLNWGLEAMRKAGPNFGAGAFFNYQGMGTGSATVANQTVTTGRNLYLYGVEARYQMQQYAEGLAISARLGVQTASNTITTNGVQTTDSTTKLMWGPLIAYDFPLTSSFTLGPEINVLFPVGDGITVTNFLAAVKVWF